MTFLIKYKYFCLLIFLPPSLCAGGFLEKAKLGMEYCGKGVEAEKGKKKTVLMLRETMSLTPSLYSLDPVAFHLLCPRQHSLITGPRKSI